MAEILQVIDINLSENTVVGHQNVKRPRTNRKDRKLSGRKINASHQFFSPQIEDIVILPQLNELQFDNIENPTDSVIEFAPVDMNAVAHVDGFGYDIGLWPDRATDMMIDYWAIRSSEEILLLQNSQVEFDKSGIKNEIRRSTKAIFSRRAQNGEITHRSWLCYSPAVGRVYCYICKLMAGDEQQLSGEGYCDWSHAGERLAKHELYYVILPTPLV